MRGLQPKRVTRRPNQTDVKTPLDHLIGRVSPLCTRAKDRTRYDGFSLSFSSFEWTSIESTDSKKRMKDRGEECVHEEI